MWNATTIDRQTDREVVEVFKSKDKNYIISSGMNCAYFNTTRRQTLDSERRTHTHNKKTINSLTLLTLFFYFIKKMDKKASFLIRSAFTVDTAAAAAIFRMWNEVVVIIQVLHTMECTQHHFFSHLSEVD